jgi:hypothetical protein
MAKQTSVVFKKLQNHQRKMDMIRASIHKNRADAFEEEKSKHQDEIDCYGDIAKAIMEWCLDDAPIEEDYIKDWCDMFLPIKQYLIHPSEIISQQITEAEKSPYNNAWGNIQFPITTAIVEDILDGEKTTIEGMRKDLLAIKEQVSKVKRGIVRLYEIKEIVEKYAPENK